MSDVVKIVLIIAFFGFLIWTANKNNIRDSQGRAINNNESEVCFNGVVYYSHGAHMGYSPKFLRDGKIQECK